MDALIPNTGQLVRPKKAIRTHKRKIVAKYFALMKISRILVLPKRSK